LIEQNSSPKKERVGSLFYHLFDRFSVWLYTILCNCLPARLLTSYETLELRWSRLYTYVIGTPDRKLRRRLHEIRLTVARLMETSKLLVIPDRIAWFFLHCPLNVFGIFFLIHGALGAAVYFVSNRMDVTYAGNIGWGIAGIAIAVCSLPLLCSSKPLYRAVFGSRIISKILRSYLGLEPSKKGHEKKERGNTLWVYGALLLGVVAGATTYFVHPFTVPVILLILVMAALVLYIPEAGVLLALATFPYWWATGHSALCAVAISGVTLISFINKLVRGKRVLHIRLLDFVVLLICLLFATHGVFTQGDLTSLLYGVGYTLLIAMYFPVVSLMRSPEWLNRCYRLLTISGAVLSVISVLPFANILDFLDMLFIRVDFSMMTELFAGYEVYFGEISLIGGMLMMLLPVMLTGIVGKRTITGFFWNMLWVVTGCLSVLATMHMGAWLGLGVMLLLFFFMYSYRALSTAMLMTFPVTCAVAWYGDINRLLNLSQLEIVQAILDVVVTFCNATPQRKAIADSVFQLSRDHALGVGLGEHAVRAVFPQYAAPGMESMTDMQNAYLQLLTECGYFALILFFAMLLLFGMSMLTYLRRGNNQITKARVAAGLAGIGGMLVFGLTCNILGSASVFMLFWLIIALSSASQRTQYELLARAVQTHGGTRERSDIAFQSK